MNAIWTFVASLPGNMLQWVADLSDGAQIGLSLGGVAAVTATVLVLDRIRRAN